MAMNGASLWERESAEISKNYRRRAVSVAFSLAL